MNTLSHRWLLPIVAALSCGCTLFHGTSHTPAPVKPLSAAELGQECSNLRANIASARHQQRTQPPTSSSPIIADSATARADQRIDDMRKRYESLGCAVAAPEGAQTSLP